MACKGAWTPAAFVPATLELELQPECAEPVLDCDARERRALSTSAGVYTIAPYALDLPTGWLHVKAVVNGQSPAHRVESAPLAVTVDPAVRVVLEVLGCDADCASPDSWTAQPRDEAGFLLKWRYNPTGTGPLGPTERLRLRLDGAEADAVVAWDVHLARAFEVWDGGPAQTCRDADADEYYRTVVEAPNLLAVADLDTPTLDFEVEPDVASSLPPAFDPGCGVRDTGRGGKLCPNRPYVLEARAWYKGRVIETSFSQTVSEVIVQEYWDHKPFDVPNPIGADGVPVDAPDGLMPTTRIPTVGDVIPTADILTSSYDGETGCLDSTVSTAVCEGEILSGNYHDGANTSGYSATPRTVGDVVAVAMQVADLVEPSPRISSGWRNPELHEEFGLPQIVSGHDWGTGVDLVLAPGQDWEYHGGSSSLDGVFNWCSLGIAASLVAADLVHAGTWRAHAVQIENPAAPASIGVVYLDVTEQSLSECIEIVRTRVEACQAAKGSWTGCSPTHVHLSETDWWLP